MEACTKLSSHILIGLSAASTPGNQVQDSSQHPYESHYAHYDEDCTQVEKYDLCFKEQVSKFLTPTLLGFFIKVVQAEEVF